MAHEGRYAVHLPYDLVHQLWLLREERGQGPIQRQVVNAVRAYVTRAFGEGGGFNGEGDRAASCHGAPAVGEGSHHLEQLRPAHARVGGSGGEGVTVVQPKGGM